MPTIPPADSPGHEPTYAEQAAEQDRLLDEKIVRMRAQLELGTITVREAAEQRIAAYSHHLLAIGDLNHEWFGEADES